MRLGFIRRSVPAPTPPQGAIDVAAPKELSRPIPSFPPTWVWVVIFVAALLGFLIMTFVTGIRPMSPMGMLFPLVMMGSMFMMMRNGGGNKDNKPKKLNDDRASYTRYLDGKRDEIHRAGRMQAIEVTWHHPDPAKGALLSIVGSDRMWERDQEAGNFGHVRMGLGISKLGVTVMPPTNVAPPENLEPVQAIACRNLLVTQTVVHDIPRPVHLFDKPGYAFFGEDREHLLGVIRAMVLQLCVFHGPDHVRCVVATSERAKWEWAKWPMHFEDPELVDAVGPARLIFDSVEEVVERFGAEFADREVHAPNMKGVGSGSGMRYVVIVDIPEADISEIIGAGGWKGVSVLELTGVTSSVLAEDLNCVFLADAEGNLLRPVQEAKRKEYEFKPSSSQAGSGQEVNTSW